MAAFRLRRPLTVCASAPGRAVVPVRHDSPRHQKASRRAAASTTHLNCPHRSSRTSASVPFRSQRVGVPRGCAVVAGAGAKVVFAKTIRSQRGEPARGVEILHNIKVDELGGVRYADAHLEMPAPIAVNATLKAAAAFPDHGPTCLDHLIAHGTAWLQPSGRAVVGRCGHIWPHGLLPRRQVAPFRHHRRATFAGAAARWCRRGCGRCARRRPHRSDLAAARREDTRGRRARAPRRFARQSTRGIPRLIRCAKTGPLAASSDQRPLLFHPVGTTFSLHTGFRVAPFAPDDAQLRWIWCRRWESNPHGA